MKNFISILLLFLAVGPIQAQNVIRQQGLVRTVGRPDNPKGKPLAGAVISIDGQANQVLSRSNGTFEIPFNHAQAGVSGFRVRQVRLGGYSLYETSLLTRTCPISPSFPLEVVMISAKEVEAMKSRFQQQVQKRYAAELAKVKAEKIRLGQRYQKELNKVNERFKNCDSYVADMVERFSHIDYATLNYSESCFYSALERGDLDAADAILKQVDADELLKARQAIVGNIEKEQAALKGIDKKLLSYYDGRFELFAARFETDSAAVYLDRLVALDTTRVENLVKAGIFYSEQLSENRKAIAFFERAIRLYEAKGAEQSIEWAKCQRKLGDALDNVGENAQALAALEKALGVYVKIEGEMSENVASCYVRMASVYGDLGNKAQDLAYLEKSTAIRIQLYGERDYRLGTNYNNLFHYFNSEKEYDKADIWFEKGVTLLDSADHRNAHTFSLLYDNRGTGFLDRKNHEEALACYQKALTYAVKCKDEYLENYATTLHNLGNVAQALGREELATRCFDESEEALVQRYGEYGTPLYSHYKFNGDRLKHHGDYAAALGWYERALKIAGENYGVENEITVAVMEKVAVCCFNTKDYGRARKLYAQIAETQSRNGRQTVEQQNHFMQMAAYCDFHQGQPETALQKFLESEAFCKKHSELENSTDFVGIYRCYVALLKTDRKKWEKPFRKYMSDKLFLISIPQTRLHVNGWDGPFLFLGYGAWDSNSEQDIVELAENPTYDPKRIYLSFQNKSYYIDDFILKDDCQINMMKVTSKLYRKLVLKIKDAAVRYWD